MVPKIVLKNYKKYQNFSRKFTFLCFWIPVCLKYIICVISMQKNLLVILYFSGVPKMVSQVEQRTEIFRIKSHIWMIVQFLWIRKMSIIVLCTIEEKIVANFWYSWVLKIVPPSKSDILNFEKNVSSDFKLYQRIGRYWNRRKKIIVSNIFHSPVVLKIAS